MIGEHFSDFVREKILTPLKMKACCSIDPSCPDTVKGYEFNSGVWKEIISQTIGGHGKPIIGSTGIGLIVTCENMAPLQFDKSLS